MIVTRYLHASKEEARQDELWPREAKQWENYLYSLYEVKIDLEVDVDTGKSRIVAVDGVPLQSIGAFA